MTPVLRFHKSGNKAPSQNSKRSRKWEINEKEIKAATKITVNFCWYSICEQENIFPLVTLSFTIIHVCKYLKRFKRYDVINYLYYYEVLSRDLKVWRYLHYYKGLSKFKILKIKFYLSKKWPFWQVLANLILIVVRPNGQRWSLVLMMVSESTSVLTYVFKWAHASNISIQTNDRLCRWAWWVTEFARLVPYFFPGELWSERIVIYFVEDVPGAWMDPANIQTNVIDDDPGVPFQAAFMDINLDGKNWKVARN